MALQARRASPALTEDRSCWANRRTPLADDRRTARAHHRTAASPRLTAFQSHHMNQPRILGLATTTPPRELPRAEWLTIARRLSPARVDARVLERLADRSGIDARACACLAPPYGESFYPSDDGTGGPTTSARMELWWSGVRDMGERAAASALHASGCSPGSITHVVTASCTGFRAPGLEMHLIEALSLPASTRRTNIGFQGCHAAVNALAVARAIVLSPVPSCSRNPRLACWCAVPKSRRPTSTTAIGSTNSSPTRFLPMDVRPAWSAHRWTHQRRPSLPRTRASSRRLRARWAGWSATMASR